MTNLEEGVGVQVSLWQTHQIPVDHVCVLENFITKMTIVMRCFWNFQVQIENWFGGGDVFGWWSPLGKKRRWIEMHYAPCFCTPSRPQHTLQIIPDHCGLKITIPWEIIHSGTAATTRGAVPYSDHNVPSQPGSAPRFSFEFPRDN